jgi:ATP-dependent exoDNAse (exonuclease V) beta subunit
MIRTAAFVLYQVFVVNGRVALNLDPQQSYLIEASAGCGKTYQLTRRFMDLVKHGARPDRILTVTFTRKAAAEMQQRIIGVAKGMLVGDEKDVAEKVLSLSPRLKIATIDSLFHEWCLRFSYEAGLEGFKLIDLEDEERVEKQSLAAFIAEIAATGNNQILEIYGFYTLMRRILELRRLGDFIALNDPWTPHAYEELSESEFFSRHSGTLLHVAQAMKSSVKDDLIQSAKEQSIDCLLKSKWITQSLAISKTYHRKELPLELEHLQADLRLVVNAKRFHRLNEEGSLLYKLFDVYQAKRQSIKKDRLEFSDLARGVWQIFHNEKNLGAQYLIQQGIEHLLIDEFQDTSPMQWGVFRGILSEITSGAGIHQGTGFLVGDAKQSIYGFREADPRIMSEALELPQIQRAELSMSYRSPEVLCNFVNQVFAHQISDFPEHASAKAAGQHANEMVMVIESFDTIEDEADYIARLLATLPPKPTALLLRRMTHASLYQRKLMDYGIHATGASDFFEEPIISDSLSVLSLLCYPNDKLSLARVLKSPFLKVSDREIREGLSQDSWDLNEIYTKLFGTLPTSTNAAALLRLLMQRFGLFHPLVYRLLELCEHHSLHTFLERMKLLSKRASIQIHQDAQVQIMSIHKSKGLEFDRVIVADTGSKWNKSDPYWLRTDKLYYIGTKAEQPAHDEAFNALKEQVQQQLDEESLRLLYVALTRAKEQLIVSGYGKPDTGFLPQLLAAAMLSPSTILEHNVFVSSEVDLNASTHFKIKNTALDKKTIDLSPYPIPPNPLRRIQPSQQVLLDDVKRGGGQKQRQEGIYLHKCLELYIKSGLNPKLVAQNEKLKKITSSPAWNTLIENHTELKSEFAFAKYIPQGSEAAKWIKGSIDLLVFKDPEQIWVVDFKSGVQDLAHYRTQMSYYLDAIGEIYPAVNIQGYIFQLDCLSLNSL